jgi:hypothetical protein
METRKIIIVDSSSNQKIVVETDATNFGELKRAARAAGINYEGKDWLEGITKTSPMSDDSLLPTNVNYKGTVTNNLVYMLTNTNKRIRSGMDRKEIYAEVNKLGLKEDIKKKYGKNYTMVSNNDLMAAINDKKGKKAVAGPAPKKVATIRKEMESVDYKAKYNKVVTAIAKFLTIIPDDILKDAADAAKNLTPETIVKEVNFSDADLKALFKK